MVKPKHTHIEFHDLITVFNDIITKHINNINEQRNEINNLADKNYIITNKYNDQLEIVEETEQELIEIKNANKLAHERIKEMEGEWNQYLEMRERNSKNEDRIKELEEQLAHSYDSGLEAVHPEDTSEQYPPEVTEEDARQAIWGDEYEKINDIDPPEPTPSELMAYCEDRLQEFIKKDLFEAEGINHVIDIRFIPKSFTMTNATGFEVYYYCANTPDTKGYYRQYEKLDWPKHEIDGTLEQITKEQFTDAYLDAKVMGALKKP